jgi:hypothetical protein
MAQAVAPGATHTLGIIPKPILVGDRSAGIGNDLKVVVGNAMLDGQGGRRSLSVRIARHNHNRRVRTQWQVRLSAPCSAAHFGTQCLADAQCVLHDQELGQLLHTITSMAPD